MKKYAVIVAGGMGLRMGAEVPKQFLKLHEHPVLWYTLDTFLSAFDDLKIVLVVPAGHEVNAKELIGSLKGGAEGRIDVVVGGDTRFHSVRRGLEAIRAREVGQPGKAGEKAATPDSAVLPGDVGENAIVFVHDGVRCLVGADLIRRCYEQAIQLGSAVPVVDCPDSVRLVDDEGRSKPIDRTRIKLVQTPQTFGADILLQAYMMDHQEAFTDEATVVEVAGHEVHLIEGELMNIKITTPEDMVIAEQLLKQKG